MKFFLCFLLVAFVSANSSEHHGPAKRFDLTKCCKVEKSAATTYFIEGMVKLADQCKKEIGNSQYFKDFQSQIWSLTNTHFDLKVNKDHHRRKVNKERNTENDASTNALQTKPTS